MTATLYVTEYTNIGSRKPNADDDIGGTIPQIPGANASETYKELDASAAVTHLLSSRTSYIKLQAVGGPVWFNFNSADASGDTLVADSRDYLPEGGVIYQGVLDLENGAPIYSQINTIDAT